MKDGRKMAPQRKGEKNKSLMTSGTSAGRQSCERAAALISKINDTGGRILGQSRLTHPSTRCPGRDVTHPATGRPFFVLFLLGRGHLLPEPARRLPLTSCLSGACTCSPPPRCSCAPAVTSETDCSGSVRNAIKRPPEVLYVPAMMLVLPPLARLTPL